MNKFRFLTLVIFILSLLCSPLQAQQTPQDPEIHIVAAGETLFSISREYNITVSELREWNSLASDNLQSGQSLRVAPPDGGNRVTHEVQQGESLFGISRNYGVTIAEIQSWNSLEGTSIEVGRTLVLYPDSSPGEQTATPSISEIEQMDPEERTSIVQQMQEPGQGSDTYVVRSGDNLTQIARRFDMSVQELRSLNSLHGDMLRVGQRLTVKRLQAPPSIAEGAENSTPQGKFASYRLQSGENTGTLLSRFQMSEAELAALNPGINVASLSSGQQVTVLLPPTRTFPNPFRENASLDDLGTVPASPYSPDDSAIPTASGELYNPDQLTAAHANIMLGSIIYVENPANNRGVFVKINDRYNGDGLKLSEKAFQVLQFSSLAQPEVTLYLDH